MPADGLPTQPSLWAPAHPVRPPVETTVQAARLQTHHHSSYHTSKEQTIKTEGRITASHEQHLEGRLRPSEQCEVYGRRHRPGRASPPPPHWRGTCAATDGPVTLLGHC